MPGANIRALLHWLLALQFGAKNPRSRLRVPVCLAYFGGCRPGLVAHLSRFSITLSWLGRFGGFESFGSFGSLISLSMTALPDVKFTPDRGPFQQLTYWFYSHIYSTDFLLAFDGTSTASIELGTYSFV
jgi:hypothetical protein